MPHELIDISTPIDDGMVGWPTGRPAATRRIVDAGDAANPRNSEWTLDVHAGTHVDAPLHWLPGAPSVEGLPLAAFVGPCTVVAVEGGAIDSVPSGALGPGRRVLFRTENSRSRLPVREFDPDFVALTPAAARQLADARVALVGIDYLSVESPSGDGGVHRTLLSAGVVLLEGLDLRSVEAGDYELSAVPIALTGAEAAPVRAYLSR